MGWFDEQGIPKGGAIEPIESGYNPVADAEAKRRSPDYVGTLGSLGGASNAERGVPSLDWRTGGGAQAPSGGQQQVSDQAVQDILGKYPATNDGMRAAMVEIDRTFGPGTIKLLEHPSRLDKLVMPDGRTIDAMVGAGAPGASWGWMVEGGGHGGAGGAGGGTLGGLSGVGVTPQGMAFVNRVMGDMGAVGPLLGDPMAGRPITDDPSFGFRMDEGAKALERSAAAKGTLLTGGHLKALQRYAQDVASTEYQNSYARRDREQGNNFNRLAGVADFMSGQQQNQYNRYLGTANLGLGATNASQNLASGYADNIGNAQIGIGNSQGVATQYGAEANANTIGNLGDIAGTWAQQYYKNRRKPVMGMPANDSEWF